MYGGSRHLDAPLQGLLMHLQAIEAGAAWKVGENGEWMRNGATLLGIPKGEQTVSFKDIAGYTKPADVKVTVADGEDFTASGTYTKS